METEEISKSKQQVDLLSTTISPAANFLVFAATDGDQSQAEDPGTNNLVNSTNASS
jgi:hypothetical protein